jgi:hypothetical protein
MEHKSLLELLGADTELEAIESLLAEREAMVEMRAEYEALKIVKRRLVVVVEMSRRAFLMLESDGAMFLPLKVRELIGKVLEQCKQLDKYIQWTKADR